MYLRELPSSGIPHRSKTHFQSFQIGVVKFTPRGNSMSPSNAYQPKPADKFSFGLWTLGNRGRDPFGDVVRPVLPPTDIVAILGEIGSWASICTTTTWCPLTPVRRSATRLWREFKKACKEHGVVVPMATVSLFFHPVFRDGAFTANDPEVCADALAEDDARDGPGGGMRREDFRVVGRT